VQTRDNLKEFEKIDFNSLSKLALSGKTEDKILASELLSFSGRFNTYKILIDLLQDENADVRKAALIASGDLKKSELWPYIIKNLADERFSNTASSAIRTIGEPILGELDIYFNKVMTGNHVRVNIINLYLSIGGQKAIDLLRNKINYPDENIRQNALLALSMLEYTASRSEITFIKAEIDEEISMIVWTMASLTDLEKYDHGRDLCNALKYELEQKKKNIFLLLSLIYESKTIKTIRDNFENGSSEARAFALEIIDLTVSDEIKETLLPLLDDFSYQDCLRIYADGFPQQKLSVKERLPDIINKNYLKVNRWTKACAIELLKYFSDVEQILAANIVNPDPLLMETAVVTFYSVNKTALFEKEKVLKKEDRERITGVIEKLEFLNTPFNLQIDKIKSLKNTDYFSGIPELDLINLADHADEIHLDRAEVTVFNKNDQKNIYCVINGHVDLYSDGTFVKSLYKGSVFWDARNENKMLEFRAIVDSSLLNIPSDLVYALMVNQSEFTEKIIDLLDNDKN
jgi:hypothetical protein